MSVVALRDTKVSQGPSNSSQFLFTLRKGQSAKQLAPTRDGLRVPIAPRGWVDAHDVAQLPPPELECVTDLASQITSLSPTDEAKTLPGLDSESACRSVDQTSQVGLPSTMNVAKTLRSGTTWKDVLGDGRCLSQTDSRAGVSKQANTSVSMHRHMMSSPTPVRNDCWRHDKWEPSTASDDNNTLLRLEGDSACLSVDQTCHVGSPSATDIATTLERCTTWKDVLGDCGRLRQANSHVGSSRPASVNSFVSMNRCTMAPPAPVLWPHDKWEQLYGNQ